MAVHKFETGRQAAAADGWCVGCLKKSSLHHVRQELAASGWDVKALPDLAVCETCRESRNQRSLNRNAARPTAKRTRKRMQDMMDGVRELNGHGHGTSGKPGAGSGMRLRA